MDEEIQPLDEWEMHHVDRIAWRKAGRIAGWEPCKWERIGPDSLVEGGVPRLLKAGEHKGRKTWRDCKLTRVIVLGSEIDAEEAAYAVHTGNCPTCLGKGDVFASWSKAEGTRRDQCNACRGSGKHVAATGPA